MEEKRCTACGQTFGCGRRDPDCWCAELPALPAGALDEAGDCLCPRCLAERVDSASEGQDAGRGSRGSRGRGSRGRTNLRH